MMVRNFNEEGNYTLVASNEAGNDSRLLHVTSAGKTGVGPDTELPFLFFDIFCENGAGNIIYTKIGKTTVTI